MSASSSCISGSSLSLPQQMHRLSPFSPYPSSDDELSGSPEKESPLTAPSRSTSTPLFFISYDQTDGLRVQPDSDEPCGFASIPMELAIAIFQKLDIGSLMRIQSVCRFFHSTVYSEHFKEPISKLLQDRLSQANAYQISLIPLSPVLSNKKTDLLVTKWRSEVSQRLEEMGANILTMPSIMPEAWSDPRVLPAETRTVLHTIYVQAVLAKVTSDYFDAMQATIQFCDGQAFSGHFLALICEGINTSEDVQGLRINSVEFTNENIITIAQTLDFGKINNLFLYGAYRDSGLRALLHALSATPSPSREMSLALQASDCSSDTKKIFKTIAQRLAIQGGQGALTTKKALSRLGFR